MQRLGDVSVRTCLAGCRSGMRLRNRSAGASRPGTGHDRTSWRPARACQASVGVRPRTAGEWTMGDASDSRARITSVLVRGLGAASLGLGLTEVLAPHKVAALAGVTDSGRTRSVIQALGLRECGHAAALLCGPDKLVWTRLAGDALDTALLVAGVVRRGPGRRRRGIMSAVALAGIGGADLYVALRTTGTRNSATGGTPRHGSADRQRTLRAAITVRRTPEEAYGFWRDLENLPSFMYHLESVTTDGSGGSHWVAKAPLGQSIEWDAQTIDDQPNKRISWQSSADSAIGHAGSVSFTPADGAGNNQGTEVRVHIAYHMPGGALGKAAATIFGESPEQQVHDDLRRFKQILETGQVMRSTGSSEG